MSAVIAPFHFCDSNGEPVDAAPFVVAIVSRAGVARPMVPKIVRVGVGAYQIDATPADAEIGTVVLVGSGSSDAFPRYQTIEIYDDRNRFAVHCAFDEGGGFASGEATLDVFCGPDGVAKSSPPELEAVPGFPQLHTLTPRAADRNESTHFRIRGPANTYPRCTWGSFDASAPAAVRARGALPPNSVGFYRRVRNPWER